MGNGRWTAERRMAQVIEWKSCPGREQCVQVGRLEMEREACQVASADPTFCPHEHVDPHPLCCVDDQGRPCSIHPSNGVRWREERGGSKARKEGVRLVCRQPDGRTVLCSLGRGRLPAVSAREGRWRGHAFFLLHARGRTAYT
jgi:hypothetical protein